jgi:hypothetical protein
MYLLDARTSTYLSDSESESKFGCCRAEYESAFAISNRSKEFGSVQDCTEAEIVFL